MDGCEVFEVLCNVPNEETGGASLFYSDQSGWVVNQAGSTIQMDKDGNINISVAKDKSMNINSPKMVIDSDEIVFNKGENKELVNIEVLEDSLNQIYEYTTSSKLGRTSLVRTSKRRILSTRNMLARYLRFAWA